MCEKCREAMLGSRESIMGRVRERAAVLTEFWGDRSATGVAVKDLRRLVSVLQGFDKVDDYQVNRVQIILREVFVSLSEMLKATPLGEVDTIPGKAMADLMNTISEIGWAFEVKEIPPPRSILLSSVLMDILGPALKQRMAAGEDQFLEHAAKTATSTKDEGGAPVGFAAPVKVRVESKQ
jgi:hypothetical protein